MLEFDFDFDALNPAFRDLGAEIDDATLYEIDADDEFPMYLEYDEGDDFADAGIFEEW
jgi:hypothetical protein